MADSSKIEWTEATWNPITGCTVLTPGCTNCYAMRLAGTRLRNHQSRKGLTKLTKAGPVWNGEVRFNEQWLDQPLRWARPRMIFVCAHGDLFHESIPDEWIDKVFAIMALSSRHTFQVLTKRAERMRETVKRIGTSISFLEPHARALGYSLQWDVPRDLPVPFAGKTMGLVSWPLRNVWLGVSCERQKEADERIPSLLDTPATIRFISAEPLLDTLDLARYLLPTMHLAPAKKSMSAEGKKAVSALGRAAVKRMGGALLDWVIIGGESGPKYRPMDETWAASILRQCNAANVAAFMKQMAGKVPIPPHLMTREFPQR